MNAELEGIIRASEWMMRALQTIRAEQLPDAWTGAGVLRDLVWGERFGSGFDPGRVHDVDVAFYDPDDLTRDHDEQITAQLRHRDPSVPWEAKNQAAVHLWYHHRFGGAPVEPLTCTADAVATWPETATAVAVRLGVADAIEVCAPYGLHDLLDGVWRRNPCRISIAQSLARLERHQPGRRWPTVTVINPQTTT